jgi:hypothetical protein
MLSSTGNKVSSLRIWISIPRTWVNEKVRKESGFNELHLTISYACYSHILEHLKEKDCKTTHCLQLGIYANQPPYRFLKIFKTFTKLKSANYLICLRASTKFAHKMNQNLKCSTNLQNFTTIIYIIFNAFWICKPNSRDDCRFWFCDLKWFAHTMN